MGSASLRDCVRSTVCGALKLAPVPVNPLRVMKIRYLLPLVFSFALGASAAQPKEYQVTGKLAVGSRVTVYYRMGATAVDVKDDGKGKSDAKAGATEKSATKAAPKASEASADKAKKAKS